ncbi:hypothetical protein WJX72_000214 [[Myrmecia] bisecta]|uniref:Uncharacterized protein n=1 Tax=[Myrmecia] bisecta TaxID=41462 RepID=A0AAW1Q5A4_9CHLO
MNQTTAGPNQYVVVDLPANSLVDLDTVSWWFLGSTSAATSPPGFPRNIEQIIERLEIEVNGQIIGGGGLNHWNHLFSVITDMQLGTDGQQRRKVLQNGADQAAPAAATTNQQFCIQNFPFSFTGGSKSRIIDTSLLGLVRLRFSLASANVLIGLANTTADATYTLSEMFFTCTTLSIDDGYYYKIHDSWLSEKGKVLELAYDDWTCVSQSNTSHDQSTRFSVSTQSLDMVIGMFLNGGYNAIGPVVAQSSTSPYFTRIAQHLKTYQFSINGVTHPNFLVTPAQGFGHMLNATGRSQDTLGGSYFGIDSIADWQNYFFAAFVRLDHPVDATEAFISGMDTRGTNMTGVFQTVSDGTSTANVSVVFAKCTRVLRVGAGMQIEVVQ